MTSALSWGSQQAVAVVLALCSALCYALAAVAQQRSAARMTSGGAFQPGLLLRLARARGWQLGMLAVLAGYGLHAAALDLGLLVVVEPVFPVGMLMALLFAARTEGRWLRWPEWTAGGAAVAGLAVFLVAAEPSGGQRVAPSGSLASAAAGAVGVALLCWLVTTRVSAHHRVLPLSIGGGIFAGVTDSLTKSVVALAGIQQLGLLGDVRLWLLGLAGLLTLTLQQNAYRAAGLAASLPAFAVLEPLVGSLLGMMVYHERVGGGGLRISVEVIAVLAAAWGIARLASSVISELSRLASPIAGPAA